MRIIDVSLPLSEGMVVYPGDGPVRFELLRSWEAGDPFMLTYLHLGAHAGTHIDAPKHFLRRGQGVEEVPLSELIGPCRVISLTADIKEIGEDVLREKVTASCRRLLLKTLNSDLYRKGEFQTEYAHLTPEGAIWLREHGVRLLGIDYYSVEKFGSERAGAHIALLEAGVCLLEGLNLAEVKEGEYLLFSLPLRLVGTEGAPARALLLEVGDELLKRWKEEQP